MFVTLCIIDLQIAQINNTCCNSVAYYFLCNRKHLLPIPKDKLSNRGLFRYMSHSHRLLNRSSEYLGSVLLQTWGNPREYFMGTV